jgi:DNA (cytosine-5)-methyltransferase 1
VADSMCSGQPGQRFVGRSSDTTPQTDREVDRVEHVGGGGRMADSKRTERGAYQSDNERDREDAGWDETPSGPRAFGEICRMADSSVSGERALDRQSGQSVRQEEQDRGSSVSSGMADSDDCRREPGSEATESAGHGHPFVPTGGADRHEPTSQAHSQWRDADWLFCRDGKWRPVEPGAFPLAHGVPARVGRLRGYGNAIVPQVAAEFIGAFTEAISP